MNDEELMTFLSVAENKSIQEAANQLFISQGTASTRIQLLEEKLGVQLFYRQRGKKGISLTPEGESLLPIAQQCSALFDDAMHLKELRSYQELKVVAIDMINTYLFAETYKKFISENDDIILTIQTEHSTELHQLIENQLSDIGFANSLHMFPNVLSKPLFSEKMVFLHHKDAKFAKTHQIHDLVMEKEIYPRWSREFNQWHAYYFPYDTKKKTTVGTVSMLPTFLGDKDTWTIVSESVAEKLMLQGKDMAVSAIDNPPPEKITYVLFHKYPKPKIKETQQIFLRYIVEYIKSVPSLTLLLNSI